MNNDYEKLSSIELDHVIDAMLITAFRGDSDERWGQLVALSNSVDWSAPFAQFLLGRASLDTVAAALPTVIGRIEGRFRAINAADYIDGRELRALQVLIRIRGLDRSVNFLGSARDIGYYLKDYPRDNHEQVIAALWVSSGVLNTMSRGVQGVVFDEFTASTSSKRAAARVLMTGIVHAVRCFWWRPEPAQQAEFVLTLGAFMKSIVGESKYWRAWSDSVEQVLHVNWSEISVDQLFAYTPEWGGAARELGKRHVPLKGDLLNAAEGWEWVNGYPPYLVDGLSEKLASRKRQGDPLDAAACWEWVDGYATSLVDEEKYRQGEIQLEDWYAANPILKWGLWRVSSATTPHVAHPFGPNFEGVKFPRARRVPYKDAVLDLVYSQRSS